MFRSVWKVSLLQPWFNCRGMLFGLDARLAITIFALLSVMIGYVSYGKIEQARRVAILKEIEAINQAFERFQADTQTFPPFAVQGGSDGFKDYMALIDDQYVKHGFRKLWNGPYLSMRTRDHSTYGEYAIVYNQSESDTPCSVRSECYLWITLNDIPEEVWQQINAYVDENYGDRLEPDGFSHIKGKIQGRMVGEKWVLYYRSVKRLRGII